jgi:hypothetical protein
MVLKRMRREERGNQGGGGLQCRAGKHKHARTSLLISLLLLLLGITAEIAYAIRRPTGRKLDPATEHRAPPGSATGCHWWEPGSGSSGVGCGLGAGVHRVRVWSGGWWPGGDSAPGPWARCCRAGFGGCFMSMSCHLVNSSIGNKRTCLWSSRDPSK